MSDAGMENLRGLASLESLNLHCTLITDSGLECLVRLTRLKSLCLFGTNVSEGGIAKIQRALPACRITY